MINHLRDKGLGVDPVCRVLELSPSTYFARKKRPKSARRLRDEQLMPLIEQVHAESGGTYGARRITRALCRKGVDVARCTVERLMAWYWSRPGLRYASRDDLRNGVPTPESKAALDALSDLRADYRNAVLAAFLACEDPETRQDLSLWISLESSAYPDALQDDHQRAKGLIIADPEHYRLMLQRSGRS
ncbi:IS3 family transposase [Streptomyces sp. NBC_01669]|uniref:IS3 family transposase n=1 Tax=Streptomyces sp. NBC_01669 TaxID=2975909 RepID=UPI00224EE20C|nr:IS3 family transposase [Streptomyces sp. NBC_01669]MCX4537930.1 IS3 family transposase [Streptomyces sp. NBC_01669]